MNHCTTATVAACAAAAASVLLTPTVAQADVHTWDGSTWNRDWQSPANWNVNAVPGTGDAVIILDAPDPVCRLSDDTANLASIYVGGGMWLSNQGHRLRVGQGIASTRIVQDAVLEIFEVPGNGKALDTDTLRLETGGQLLMSGGRVEVDDEFRGLAGTVISGHGRLEVLGGQDAAFGAGSGRLEASGGTLRLDMLGGGTMSLPADITIAGDGARLRLNGALHDDLLDLEFDGGGRLTALDDWGLDGTLHVGGGGAVAEIDGGGTATITGLLRVDSQSDLVWTGDVDFVGADIEVVTIGAELRFDGGLGQDAATSISVGVGARLHVTENVSGSVDWNGPVHVAGGRLAFDRYVAFWDQVRLEPNGFDLPSVLEGTGPTHIFHSLYVDTEHGRVDADVTIHQLATLFLPSYRALQIGGRFTMYDGATFAGSGPIEVLPTGELTGADGTRYNGDVFNAGGLVNPGTNGGLLEVGGDYGQTSDATLRIRIGGTETNEAGRLDAGGTVDLAGTLQVDVFDWYDPNPESEWVIVSGDAIDGVFETIVGPANMQVEYRPGQVVVRFDDPSIHPADVDADGSVDFGDVLAVLGAWGACPGCPEDVNGDGVVDFMDLLAVLAAYGTV